MTKIPMIFHFTFDKSDWTDVHTLCLRTAIKIARAQKCVVHYNHEGDGAAWDEARILDGVEWRRQDFRLSLNGYDISDQKMVQDVHRLRTLFAEGGFYCTLDFVFLRSFETLRSWPALIGIQCRQKSRLNSALIASVPFADFIGEYLKIYYDWFPENQKHFTKTLSAVPWELSQKFPVKVMERPAFYPVAASNNSFWSGAKTCLRNSYAIHLWESMRPDIRVDDLKRTILREVIDFSHGSTLGASVTLGGGKRLTFE